MVQARQEACRSTAEDSKPVIPEVAWPLMDLDAAGRGAVRGYMVRDGSQSSLRTQDQGSVSDCDTELASSDDEADDMQDEADEMQKLSHMAVVLAEALEDDRQKLTAYSAGSCHAAFVRCSGQK